ncbi:arginine N-succinyltransferase [Sphingomonas sanxanigenens]|uniref:Arginine N-succinyltransferase n=1 Tax=Sphingomonas sanxanigenens DSM 19645 = NX02 TaxID=1123269 RepID=W0ADD9_9SPHN|nr:arginine N-succinyltransferase [Sphingomonas sanxanigenens]AHE54323.1 hypothetical protein NX02_13125 [Sphingomonas sanxanigenens DSM 19645 = NX02]
MTALLVRPATHADLDGLVALAGAGGPGLTNLPADPGVMAERLAASDATIASHGGGRAVMLVLADHGHVVGSGMIFPRVGVDWPFYSYRISRHTQRSAVTGGRVSYDTLSLTNDFDGCSEVGGLLVDPAVRRQGAGRLIARARYLFIAQHRDWFGDRIVAELRGVQADGRSPFWDAVGSRFYDMSFEEADRLNGIAGNQMIADLGPRFPIHVNLLSEEARAAIGQPHRDGRKARELLLAEGYREEGYVDIFDAGPTLCAEIDTLAAVRDSRCAPVAAIAAIERQEGTDSLIACGTGAGFRVVRGLVYSVPGGIVIEPAAAEALMLSEGNEVRHVRF